MYRKKAVCCLIILLTVLFLLLAGCAAKKEVRRNRGSQELSFATPEMVQSIDPVRLVSTGDYTLAAALFEGLIKIGEDGNVEPALAEDWVVENDGRKYTFYLRDASWSDGTKIVAADFEYAWKRALDPALDCQYSYLFYDIRDAENYNRSGDSAYQGKTAAGDSVAVKAVNENTLVVELKTANSAFLKKLSHPVFSPLPAAVHQSMADTFFSAEKLVGNGPFKLKELGADSFVLSKNESYWDRENVRLEALKGFHMEGKKAWELYGQGDLDLVFGVPLEMISQGKAAEQGGLIPLLSNYYYLFNTQKPPLNETDIRKALSFALDRRHLAEQVLKGGQNPAGGILPPMMTDGEAKSRRQEGLPFKPEEAQALLAKAGFSGGEGFPILELLIREGEGHYYLASALKEQWQQVLGIDVQIVALPWEKLSERLKQRNFQIALQGFSADYADHYAFLEPFGQGSGNNYSGWTQRGLQEEIERLKTESDEGKRRELFLQAERLVLEGMPLLPIFDYTRTYAAKPWVQGLYFPAVGPLADFKKTFLE